MAKKEVAEIIMRNVYSYKDPQVREQLESYILGETNIAPSGNDIRQKMSMYQAYGFENMSCFDENKNFIDNEDGEVLKRYTELMYKEAPDKLSAQFQLFSGKYSLYKNLGFSKAFIKEDFQKTLLYTTRYWWQTEKESVNKFIENYKDIANEYIDEYDKVNGNAAFAAGIPMLTTVTLAPVCSFICKAASRACLSSGFIIAGTPSLINVPVFGSILTAVVSGTCFTQTTIFILKVLLS